MTRKNVCTSAAMRDALASVRDRSDVGIAEGAVGVMFVALKAARPVFEST